MFENKKKYSIDPRIETVGHMVRFNQPDLSSYFTDQPKGQDWEKTKRVATQTAISAGVLYGGYKAFNISLNIENAQLLQKYVPSLNRHALVFQKSLQETLPDLQLSVDPFTGTRLGYRNTGTAKIFDFFGTKQLDPKSLPGTYNIKAKHYLYDYIRKLEDAAAKVPRTLQVSTMLSPWVFNEADYKISGTVAKGYGEYFRRAFPGAEEITDEMFGKQGVYFSKGKLFLGQEALSSRLISNDAWLVTNHLRPEGPITAPHYKSKITESILNIFGFENRPSEGKGVLTFLPVPKTTASTIKEAVNWTDLGNKLKTQGSNLFDLVTSSPGDIDQYEELYDRFKATVRPVGKTLRSVLAFPHAIIHHASKRYMELLDNPFGLIKDIAPVLGKWGEETTKRIHLDNIFGTGGKYSGNIGTLWKRHFTKGVPIMLGLAAGATIINSALRRSELLDRSPLGSGLLGVPAELIKDIDIGYSKLSEKTGLTRLSEWQEEKLGEKVGIKHILGFAGGGYIAGHFGSSFWSRAAIGGLAGEAWREEDIAASLGNLVKKNPQSILSRIEQKTISKFADRGLRLTRPRLAGLAGAAIMGGAALVLSGGLPLLASRDRADVIEKEYAGTKPVVGRKGRFWEAGSCISKNTIIPTNYFSSVPASQIKIGDKVIASDGRCWPVVNIYSRLHKGTIYHIKTASDRNIITSLTGNHILPTLKELSDKKEWISKANRIPVFAEAKTLKVGDFVEIPKPKHLVEKIELNILELLKEYKLIVENKKVYSATTNYFNNKLKKTIGKPLPLKIPLNKNIGRLIGYFLAEGNLSFNKNGPSYIETVHNLREKWIVDDIINICQLEFNYTPTVKHRITFSKVKKGAYVVRICHTLLARLFFEIFYKSNRKNDKLFPEWLLKTPIDFLQEVLEGLWRGDGHTSGKAKILSSTRYNYIQLAKYILLINNYSFSVPKKDCSQQKKYPSRLPKFCIRWSVPSTENPERVINFQGRIFTKIVEIEEEDYNDIVYDFEIEEESHLFQAGTFLVHNSPWEGNVPTSLTGNWYQRLKSDAREASLYPEDYRYKPIKRFFKGLADPYWLEKCVAKGTLIIVNNFLTKPIEEIEIGDLVLTHNNNFKPVLETWSSETDVLKVITVAGHKNFPLKTTVEHKLLALKTKICPKRQTQRPNGRCFEKTHIKCNSCSYSYYKNYTPEWIEADKLNIGDFLLFPANNLQKLKEEEMVEVPQLATIEKYWTGVAWSFGSRTDLKREIKITPELAEWVGWYLAEGWTTERGVQFALSINEDEYAKRIAYLTEFIFGVSPKIKKYPKYGRQNVLIHNIQIANWAKKALSHKAKNKEIPSWLLVNNPKILFPLLFGIFRGDGTACEKTSVSFTTVSRNLAFQVLYVLSNLGFIPTINTYQPKKENEQLRFRVHLHGKEGNNFRQGIGWEINKKAQPSHWSFRFKFKEQDYIAYKIIDTKSLEEKTTVYDLKIEDDHSFMSVGGLCHNTHYFTRPYPVAGPSSDFSQMWGLTFGKLFKPEVKMHTDQMFGPATFADEEGFAGRELPEERPQGQLFTPSPKPQDQYSKNMGGLPQEAATLPSDLRQQAYKGWQNVTTKAGLFGYGVRTLLGIMTGEDSLFEDVSVLQDSSRMTSPSRRFYDLNSGGWLGINESIRRILFPQRFQKEVRNPLPNLFANVEWMPGPESRATNFKEGDPYQKIMGGESRLPGAGYVSDNPELAGVAISEYPDFFKYKILADVAPYSDEFKFYREQVGRQYRAGMLPQEKGVEFEEIEAMLPERKSGRKFLKEPDNLWGEAWTGFKTFSRLLPTEHISPLNPIRKLTGPTTALEYYKEQLISPEFAPWNTPVESYIKPAVQTSLELATGGNFPVPEEVQKRRELDEYFDKLKYLKYQRLGAAASSSGEWQSAREYFRLARETAFGVNPLAPFSSVMKAIPKTERDYFKEFIKIDDSDKREEIRGMVPGYLLHILEGQWAREDLLNKAEDATIAAPLIEAQLQEMRDLEGFQPTSSSWRDFISQREDRMSTGYRAKKWGLFARTKQLENYFESHELPQRDWAGFCVPETQKIKINYFEESLASNVTEVLTKKGRIMKVNQIFKREVDEEIYKITVSHNTVDQMEATQNHLILAMKISDCKYRPAFNFKVCLPESYSKNWKCKFCTTKPFEKYKIEWIPIKELTTSHYLITPKLSFPKEENFTPLTLDLTDGIEWPTEMIVTEATIRPKRGRISELPRKIQVTEDLCWLIGYYLADGNVWQTKERFRGLQITGNIKEAETYLFLAQQIIEKTFGVKSNIIKRHRKTGSSAYLRVNSGTLGLIFNKWCGRYSDKKTLPEWLFNLPLSYQKSFLEGVLNGDGGKDGRNILILTNYEIVAYIKELYNCLNIPANLRFLKTLNSKINKQTFGTNPLKRSDKIFFSQNYVFTRIEKIEKRHYSGPVYDFEVPKDHSYATRIGIYHNSPEVDLDDIKIRQIQSEGEDIHDYNLWESQSRELWRKPYVTTAQSSLEDWNQVSNNKGKIRQQLHDMLQSYGLRNIELMVEDDPSGSMEVELNLLHDRTVEATTELKRQGMIR